jgi:diguanylate cyclase (GGDEF)-like protein
MGVNTQQDRRKTESTVQENPVQTNKELPQAPLILQRCRLLIGQGERARYGAHRAFCENLCDCTAILNLIGKCNHYSFYDRSRRLIMSSNRRGSETTSRQEFQHSLQLLDQCRSWFIWGSVGLISLLPVTIVLLSLPPALARLGPFQGSAIARGLLGLMWAMSILTLRQQWRLKLLRQRLIEQMDAATKHRLRAEKFYGMSILDPLTGLYNRRFGETRLQEEIARAEKSGEPLLVLALDFDWFKEINDRYGHAAGDLALKLFSRRLQRAIRACDIPIRVGGDEFLVILPECLPDKVELILSRMKSLEVNLDGQKIPVLFSRGVAQYQVNDTPETIIRRADERLYAEKSKRDSVEV